MYVFEKKSDMQKILKLIIPVLYIVGLFPVLPQAWGRSYIVFFILFLFCAIFDLKILLSSKSYRCFYSDICFIIFLAVLKILNVIHIHSYLLSLVIFVTGLCVVTGLYAEYSTKIRMYWLNFLTVLCLPIAEYTQIFIGTPLRFISASVVENILSIFGCGMFLQSTIINLENTLTNIDYPCSGNNSILVIMIFATVIGYIFRVKLSAKLLLTILLSISCFIFFNIVRILTLVFLYNLKMLPQEYISVIHTSIGLINFGLVVIFIYYSFKNISDTPIQERSKYSNCSYLYVLTIALILLCFKFINIKSYDYITKSSLKSFQGTSFTEREVDFFNKHNAQVEKTVLNNGIIKLTVKSCRWTSHHNPENCIKGSGRKILSSKVIRVGEQYIRAAETDKGYVYYYFSDGKTVTDDYYKRVYYSMFTKSKCWSLIEYSSKYQLDELALSDILN